MYSRGFFGLYYYNEFNLYRFVGKEKNFFLKIVKFDYFVLFLEVLLGISYESYN